MFGLTATDFRSDGKDIMITAGVGKVLIKRDLIWGIANKWLADPYFIVRGISTIGKEYKDDKLKNYKEHVVNCKAMNDRVIADIQKFLAAGMSVLCLVDQVDHGTAIAKAVGLPFATGEDKMSKEYVKQLNDGSIPGLIGTAAYIGEGTDTKNVHVLVLANFTASKGPLWQNLGRGLRLIPGKTEVIVLDYIPKGSSMLARHAKQRIAIYKEVTDRIKIIDGV
jgi:superfamily II DNA or RNA helicase